MQFKKLIIFYVILSIMVFLASGLWYPILSDSEIKIKAFLYNGAFAVMLLWITATLTRQFVKRSTRNTEYS